MTDDVKQRCEQWLDELELLQSVFSQPGEFLVEDEDALSQVKAFSQDLCVALPSSVSCSVHLSVDHNGLKATLSVLCRLGQDYPNTLPEVSVRSDGLSRVDQDNMNADLHEFMTASITPGEQCLLSVVEWARGNAEGYLSQSHNCHASASPDTPGTDDDKHFCRMWLYMHHIYSKTKRRNILSTASELELTGFSLPGKPGVVCVEGDVQRTKEFYSVLRRWNWKSITCRKKEVISTVNVQSERKIKDFQELNFDTHGPRSNHMDLGQFRDYLKEHGLDYMFTELFAIGTRGTS